MGAVFGGSWRLSPPREGFGAETSQNGLPNANHHYNRFKPESTDGEGAADIEIWWKCLLICGDSYW